jgi:hypothetical protein
MTIKTNPIPVLLMIFGVFLLAAGIVAASCSLSVEELGPPDSFGRAFDGGQVDGQDASAVVAEDLK